VQAALNRRENGVIDLLPAFSDGLAGLDGFDYAWLLTWLGPIDVVTERSGLNGSSAPSGSAPGEPADAALAECSDRALGGGWASTRGSVPLTQVPFLLRPKKRAMGIFATRGPRRINPIGLSLVQILSVVGSQVRFAGVDVVDGTPVIDLKPYVTQFDRPDGEPRCGWFDAVPLREAITPEELRPAWDPHP
jgi:tRNA (Thr-GGU) A37 N-methylase